MTLPKIGYISLLIGVLLLISSIFFTTNWSIAAWLILFIVSLIFCATGILMLILHLVKQIRIDKLNKQ